MKKRFFLFLTVILVLSTALAACGGASTDQGQQGGTEAPTDDSGNAPAGEEISLRLAHVGSETHQYNIASVKFKELVEEKSNGQIKIEIYTDGVLGDEGEVVEQILDGTMDITTVSADSSFANTVPEMNLFGIPFLFRDIDHVYATLDGEVGQELLEIVDQKGMKALGFWEVGLRHVTNNKRPINTPEDMNGLKIRVQPAPVWEAHMQALGASPTPVGFNELYTALDQGVVDGQENPLNTIDSMKFYEVQPYLALTGHTYSPAITVMSQNAWNQLSVEQQAIIEEAFEEAKVYQRETLNAKNEEILAKFEAEGITITNPDLDSFRKATFDVRNVVSAQVPAELIEKVENVQ